MRGHEAVRTAVRDLLIDRVPGTLSAHLAEIGQPRPDPGELHIVLGDSLQVQWDFPVIVVRSTTATRMRRVGGPGSAHMVRYAIELLVAVDNGDVAADTPQDEHDDASGQRDRLLLAVRDALHADGPLPEGMHKPAVMSEQTGAIAETLAGRLLAAGTIAITVDVAEPPAAPADGVGKKAHLSASVVAHDASEQI